MSHTDWNHWSKVLYFSTFRQLLWLKFSKRALILVEKAQQPLEADLGSFVT